MVTSPSDPIGVLEYRIAGFRTSQRSVAPLLNFSVRFIAFFDNQMIDPVSG